MALQNLLLLAFIAGTIAGPVSQLTQTCATSCESSRHGYQPGQTYDYDLTTTVTTSIPGATEDQSSLTLTALAHVEVLSPCDLALRLEEVLLKEGQENVDRVLDFKRGLEENTLRFSLSNGEIKEVCPMESEPIWALNIKRGVLSTLQNTMADYQTTATTTETDVVGECPVAYEASGSTWSGYTVKKVKDLLACSQPTHANTIFQTMSYKVPSKVQSLPLLKSTHECLQELTTDGRITKSVCTESHIFRPFSREESGASTVITQSLVFKSQSSGVRTPNQLVTRFTDLKFEHVPEEETRENAQSEVMKTLQQICDVTQQGIRPEVPGLFGDLVKGMRRMDQNSLVNLGRRVSRLCDKAESFFRDAVPTLGTSAAIALMRDMIRGGKASESETDMWLTSLAFIPKPDSEMLTEVRPLLEIESIRRKSYLAVSTMVSSYCRQNSECDRERPVRDIISVFQANLGRDCGGDREVVLMALKALGNTGHAQQVINILNNCITNEAASMEVRVAAINAMRRMDCNADTTTLIEVFRSTYTDSELRINAYLALMRCPNEMTLTAVRRMLETEEINQVGSFIWTHLTNLMETASPLKQQIRSILQNEKLKKEFDLDKRKFSRNIEWSAFSEGINTGVAVESNLIWSTQSFVPRSAMVNLTVDLFGQSVNLVEFGGRIQGLDAILENMFADKQEGAAKTNNRINNLDNSFKRRETDPQGSYYVRVFGNEIRYEDFVGFDTQSIKDKLNYLQWLIELAKEHDFDFTKSMLLLESEMKIPTIAGMPLVLSVDGTATMDLKIKGKIDLRSIASSPSAFDITGTVRPTAAIQVNGKMGVDAFVARTGLKMSNTFHTSTMADGSITLKDGKIFNLDINMPTERMEIFSAQSKFFITFRGQDKEQQMPSEGRFEAQRCFAGKLVSALGVELCGDVSLPKLTKPDGPWFPLTGPVSASLTLNKRDSFTKFHMEAKAVQEKVGRDLVNHEIIFSFNTPGSRFDREFTANFVLNNADKALRFDLRTPWKKIGMTGSLVNNNDLKRITSQLILDDSAEYSFTSELQINDGKYATRYIPSVEITRPGMAPHKLSGTITYREGKKFDIDISIDNVFEEPASLKGLVRKIEKNDQTRIETDMEARVMSFKGQMSGFVDSTYNKDELKADTELTIKYRTDSGPQSISLTNKFLMQTTTQRDSVVMSGSLASSLYPEYDSDYSMQVFSEDKEAGLSLNMGLTKDKPKRITVDLQGKMDIESTLLNALVQGMAKITFIEKEWEMKIEHNHSPSELKTTWMGRKDSNEANWEVTLKQLSKDPLRLAAEVKMTYPGREVSYTQTLVQEANVFNHDLNIKIDNYDLVTLTSVYKMGRRHQVSADLKVQQYDPVHVEGFIQLDMSDFAAEAKTTYGRQSYSSDLQWKHQGYRNFNNKASWNLMLNRNQIGVESDVSYQNGNTISHNIQVKWDFNREMKKVAASGTYILSRSTPSVQTRVEWWPNNFVEGNVNLNIQENVEGRMRFQSSFSEAISAAFKHERTPSSTATTAELTWAPRQKIDGVVNLRKINGWSNVNMELTLNTPFPAARRIRSDITYNLEGQTLTATGQATWNNDQITFETTSTLDLARHNIDMTIRGTTPFNGYENVAVVIKHNDAGRICKSELKLDVASRQLVSIDFNMDHQRNGYFISNAGTLNVNLPITGYSTNKLTWNHDNNARDVRSNFVLEIENDRSVLDLEVKNRRTFSIKASLQTPYMPNARLILEHQSDRRDRIYKTAGSVQYGSDSITLDNDFSLLDNSFTLKTKVTTPYNNWQEMTLDLSNVKEGNTFRANNQFTCGMGHVYGLSGHFTNNDMPSFTTELRITSPQTGEFTINAANEKQMNIWVSSASALYSGNQKINIETKLGLGEMKKVSIDIKTPYEAMQEVSFDLEHRGIPEKFDTKVKFFHNMLNGRIEGELNVDVADVNDIKIKVSGQTPYPAARTVRSIISHKATAGIYQTDFSVELPRNKITASNTVRLTSDRNFNTVTSLEYTTGKKIELELNVNVERNIAISAVFRSPLTGEQTASLTHQGPWNNFETSVTLSPRPSETISGQAQFSLRGDNVKGVFKITTPYSSLQVLEVTLNHRGSIFSFENDVVTNYNGKRITGNSRFTLDDRGFRGEVNANTPFRNYRNNAFVFSHNGDLTSFNSKYELTYDGQKITAIGDYTYNYRGVTGRFELTTPYRQLRTASINFEHNGGLTDFRNTGNLRYNENQYSGESSFTLQGSVLRGTANLRLPEEYSLEVNHNGQLMDFNNNAALRFNGQAVTVSSNFKMDGNNLEASVVAETPFNGYRNLGATFTHKGVLANHECELTLRLQDITVIGRQTFKLSRDSIVHTINIQTPFSGYTNLAYGLKHETSRNRMTQELSLSKEEDKIELRDNFRMTPSKITGSINLNTPFRVIRETAISFFHNWDNYNFNNELTASLNRDTIKAKSSYSLRGSNAEATISIETPFNGYSRAAATMKHTGPPTSFNNEITLSLENTVITSINSFTLDDDRVSADFKIETPFEAARLLRYQLNHNGRGISFNNDMTATYNDIQIISRNTLGLSSSKIEGNFNIETPFNGFRTMALNIQHQGGWRNFNCEYSANLEDKKFTIRNSFKIDNAKLDQTFVIETPFPGYSTMGFSVKHNGPVTDFTNEISANLERTTIQGRSTFKLVGSNVDFSVSANTPFRQARTLGISLKHNGPVTDFTNEISANIGSTTIQGRSNFKVVGSKVDFAVSANTPFSQARTLGISLKHNGPVTDFTNEISANLGSTTIQGRSNFKLVGSKVDFSASVNTPFRQARTLGISLKHNGRVKDFTNEISANLGSTTIQGRSNFKLVGSKVDFSASVNTPFSQARNLAITIKHDGPIKNFKNEATMQYNEQRYTTNTEFTLQSEYLKLGASVQIPEVYGIAFEHRGPWTGFNNNLVITIAGEPHTATSSFNYGDKIEGNMNINTPKMPMTLRFSHEGELSNFKQDSALEIAGKTYSHTGEFNMQGRKCSGNFGINTPHDVARSLSAKLEHQGKWNNFDNSLVLERNGDTVRASSSLTVTAKRVKGDITIKTPKEYSIELTQKGSADDLTAIIKVLINDEKSQANIGFKNKPNVLEGSLNIRTPYRGYRNMGGEFQYKNKKVMTISGNLKTPFDRFDNFALTITHQGDAREFTTAGKIESPFRFARVTTFELNHKGRLNNFEERAFVDVDQKRISGNAAYRYNAGGLQATVSVETPFEAFKTGSASLTHNGQLTDFSTSGNVDYNGQKMEGTVSFKKADTIEGHATLVTPFEAVQRATVNFNHQGSGSVFRTSTDMSLNDQEIRANIDYNRQGTILEASGSLSTPFRQMKEGKFILNHRGYYDDFTTSGQLEFDRRKIEGELVYKLRPDIITTARLTTPWQSFRQFNFNLNHHGYFNDFTTVASGEVNGQRMNANVAFKKNGYNFESSATINTPFEAFPEWAYTLTNTVQRRSIRSAATMTLPIQAYKNFRGEFEADGSLDNFRSTLKVNTPFQSLPEGIATVSHRGNMQDFATTGSLQYSGRRVEGEVSVKITNALQQAVLKMSTPYRQLRNLHIVLDNQRRGAEMTGRVEATYNSQKHVDFDFTINVNDYSSFILNMRAPITLELNGKNEEQSKAVNMNVPNYIALTSNLEKDSEKFTHTTRVQFGNDASQVVSYRTEGSASVRNGKTIYDGRFTLNSRYGEFESTMSHKISPGPHYVTELQVQRLRLNSDIALRSNPDFQATFTMGHPTFTRDVVFGVEGSMGNSYNGKINLEYADQRFEFVGKVADESPSTSDTKYVAEAHLTHPASYLDVQFSSQLTNNDEKMGGNMEVKYMMTRDRQLKSNALRAEINKLRQELNMELNTPVKRVTMSGRRVEEAKGQHFTVVGNVDDRDMSADVQFNMDEPSFDINLQLDRDNKVIVSGKYAEPASLQLEAYREEFGRRIRESEVSVTVNSDNLINARAFLNPSAYDDMRRLFGFDLGLEKLIDDVWRTLGEEMRTKRAYLGRALQPVAEAWTTLTTPIMDMIYEMYSRNDYYIGTVVDNVIYCTGMASDYFTGLYYRYGDHLARKWIQFKMMCQQSSEDVKYFMTEIVTPAAVKAFTKTVEIVEYLQNHPTVSRFMKWVESMEIEEYYSSIRDYCIKLVKQYNAMLDSLNQYWEKFQDIPGMSYVIEYVRKVVDGLRWVYDASELDELIQAWMRELRAHGWRAIRNWWQSKNNLVEASYNRWEPEQGEYDVQIKVPVSFSEIISLPSFSLSKYWEQLMATISHILPDLNFSFGNNWSFWDAFYTYKPSRNPTDWVPPFNTHATMAGSQHFMTFDKKFYEFAGACSYLLARDFIDGKFSVIINYDNVDGVMAKKSITVHLGEKEIEILPDFKVLVDGRQSEIPVVYGKTVIRRIGNLIQIDNEHGLNVTCDLPHDRCTVQVTGWYYSKTGGLLGTYDNEPATDFQKSDRSHSSSVEDFAQSWNLGRRCPVVNKATQVSPSTASTEYRMCARYFEEEGSPFRLCFGQIEPSSFQSMCVNEVSKSTNREEAVCKIASFYVEECKMSNVPVRMPKDCVKCTAADGSTMEEGQTITISDKAVPKAADVVFVVSHKSCNREVIGRLGDIVDQMERNFRQAGIRDVRFGLVGYGLSGMLSLPHSHTFDGELFNAGNKFNLALSSFEITNDNTEEDSLAALRFAARYPFRPGVSKSIALVPCDSCQEREVSYPDIQRLLLDRDIRMHLLLQHDFQLRTSAPKTAYIFGVDRVGLFTPRSVNDEQLNGDEALRQQVYMPKDLCAALSQESDGSIFSVKQLLEARTVVQKKFLDVLTRLTAKKGAPTDCQICECVADSTGVGMSVCRSCTPSAPMNRPWFEYGDSFEQEENESTEEEVKKPKPKEEKNKQKQGRRPRLLERNKKQQ